MPQPLNTFETLVQEIVQNTLKTQLSQLREQLRDEFIQEFKEYITEVPITQEEACVILGCEPSTLAKHRANKDHPLPYIKGRPCKYIRSDIKKWLKQHKGTYTINA